MSRDHYVSRFHLREFCDPTSLSTPDPWLWIGTLTDQVVKRRSPKNVATAPNLFAGPGAFDDSKGSVETFLANDVESPAAFALRALRGGAELTGGALPPPLMRYLAWAASRSLPLQRLYAKWGENSILTNAQVAEPPPEGLLGAARRHRSVRLLHPTQGEKLVAEDEDPSQLIEDGWFPDPTERDNFLEGAHIQAYYFQARWFPRLKWFTLRPPPDSHFILGDRPVGWGVPNCLDAPPSCLRHPAAFLIAPLSPTLALVGRNSTSPWSITPSQVNAVLAAWSFDWIVGPTRDCVATALRDRGRITEVWS